MLSLSDICEEEEEEEEEEDGDEGQLSRRGDGKLHLLNGSQFPLIRGEGKTIPSHSGHTCDTKQLQQQQEHHYPSHSHSNSCRPALGELHTNGNLPEPIITNIMSKHRPCTHSYEDRDTKDCNGDNSKYERTTTDTRISVDEEEQRAQNQSRTHASTTTTDRQTIQNPHGAHHSLSASGDKVPFHNGHSPSAGYKKNKKTSSSPEKKKNHLGIKQHVVHTTILVPGDSSNSPSPRRGLETHSIAVVGPSGDASSQKIFSVPLDDEDGMSASTASRDNKSSICSASNTSNSSSSSQTCSHPGSLRDDLVILPDDHPLHHHHDNGVDDAEDDQTAAASTQSERHTMIPVGLVKQGLSRKQVLQLSAMSACGFLLVAIIILWVMSPALF